MYVCMSKVICRFLVCIWWFLTLICQLKSRENYCKRETDIHPNLIHCSIRKKARILCLRQKNEYQNHLFSSSFSSKYLEQCCVHLSDIINVAFQVANGNSDDEIIWFDN